VSFEHQAPPRWDLHALFPGLGSRQLADARDLLRADLGRVQGLYDHHDVGPGPARTPDDADVEAVVALREPLQVIRECPHPIEALQAIKTGL
jgi:hypothetical protein